MKKFFIGALAIGMIASMSLQSCIGSFSLTHKLLNWNEGINSKFVNELVFFAFWILPVYEVSALADLLVINSIEFWSGSSPVTAESKIIDGQDGKYLCERDANGYTITSLNDGSVTRLNFHEEEQTWTVVVGEEMDELPLLTFVDETHVKVPVSATEMRVVDLASEQALYAYQAEVTAQ
ncbi:MAG: DUF3332 domain-containing protein [Bacteroidales bacterium]|nr:DUF3332 domain-containing protein [Bacteroidales bacterium]